MLEISKIDFNLKNKFKSVIDNLELNLSKEKNKIPFDFDMNVFRWSQKFSIFKPLDIFGFPSPLVQIFEIFGLTIETYSLTYMYFPYLNFTNSWKNSKNNANNSWKST